MLCRKTGRLRGGKHPEHHGGGGGAGPKTKVDPFQQRGHCPGETGTIVEKAFTPRGLRFPGLVDIPPTVTGEDEREQRNDRAGKFASEFEEVEHTFWTDGSAYPGGVAAGAVVTYLVDQDMSDEDPLVAPRVEIERRGVVVSRPHGREDKRKRGKERTYKESKRSFVRYRCEGGLVAEAWTLKGRATAFDAELSALARAIDLCAHQATPDTHFRIFTNSQAAMRRIVDDRPGPGQREAIHSIHGAGRVYQRGASISVHWVPGHAGIAGNEIADQWAGDAAARELRHRARTLPSITRSSPVDSVVSGSFMKAMLRRRAVGTWRECIIRGSRGRRPYRIPGEGTVPRIPAILGRTGKGLASRFFQLASGHAMTAPFLKDKFGWVDSDQCWWCSGGRQSREHLFKECHAWKNEIRELWRKVGEISNTDRVSKLNDSGGKRNRIKRRKGFGFISRKDGQTGQLYGGKVARRPKVYGSCFGFFKGHKGGTDQKGSHCEG